MLSAAGFGATANEHQVMPDRPITARLVNEPGITDTVFIPVPALSPDRVLVLVLGIAGAGLLLGLDRTPRKLRR